jgi:outer membrane protein assembly factor BamE (lipoprotein component of BamABCDE complex)
MQARTAKVVGLVVLLMAAALVTRHAFGPPIPPGRMAQIKPGMSEEDVRRILGAPEHVIRGGHAYTSNGTRHVTGGQWTYTRPFTFGYVNVLFDTNGVVEYAHREEF